MRLLAAWMLLLSGCSREKSSGVVVPEPSGTMVAATAAAPDASPQAAASASASAASPAAAPAGASAAAAASGPPAVVPELGGIGLTVPATVKPGEKRPFVLYLHGLGASGKVLVDRLGLGGLAADKRFVYAAPDGALDHKKQRFWNAWRSCCDMDQSGVDHVEALRRLIGQAAAHPSVDPKKIYVVGFSNGGFMAHRLACEVAGLAAIASVAGAGPGEGEQCTPAGPVAVLQVHGDADDVIAYEGGHPLRKVTLPRHPAARETVAGWAQRNGCSAKPPGAASALDLEEKLPDAETSVSLFGGCKRPVALWTVHGGNHFVTMHRHGQESIYAFLEGSSR